MPESKTFDKIRFACVTCGYIGGVLIMFVLGILTDEIVPRP